ncbi:MAG TPA: hypothetical protein VGK20_09460 [Candidatus Binatia bacterium]|jgi:hypothetical protein
MKSRTVTIALSLSVSALVAACAAHRSEPAAAAPAGESHAKAAASTPPPAGSKLAQINHGMADTDVRRILGEPDTSHSYMTGKQFIPGYAGTDTARTEYIYHGQGRITLSRNQYTGGLSVIRVEYNPGL